MRAALALLVLLMLPGCTAPDPSHRAWTPLACDTSGATWVGTGLTLAPPRGSDLEGDAVRLADAVDDHVESKLMQRNDTAGQPLAGQWRTTLGLVTMESESLRDGAVDGAYWPGRHWMHQADRTWPSAEPDEDMEPFLQAVSAFTGIPGGALNITVGGEEDEGRIAIAVGQAIGDLPPILVATLDLRPHPQYNTTRLDFFEGAAVPAGLAVEPLSTLASRADAFVPCWLAARPAAPEHAGNASLVRGQAATHVMDGGVVVEFGYSWPAASGGACFGSHPLGIIVDAASGAVRDVRISAGFDACRPVNSGIDVA